MYDENLGRRIDAHRALLTPSGGDMLSITYRCCTSLFQINAMINIMSTNKCLHIREVLAQRPNSSIVCTRGI